MSEKTRINAKILGNEYLLMADESEEYLKGICKSVNAKIKEISKDPLLKPLKIAVLTSVNFCDDYTKTKIMLDDLKSDYDLLNDENTALKKEIESLKAEINYLKNEIKLR